MLQYRELFDEKRVIDFGCGKTPYYRDFFRYKEYVPVDKAIDGTDITKKMDVRGDCGICFAVLEHCKDPVAALVNMRECIGDGYLLLGVSIKYCLHMLPEDYYRFTPEFWRVVEECGFDVIEKKEVQGRGLDKRRSSMLMMLCKGR